MKLTAEQQEEKANKERDAFLNSLNKVLMKYENTMHAFYSIHQGCIMAAAAMISDSVDKHTSYIEPEEVERYGVVLDFNGRLPKVTIEWVDESEADNDR